MTRWFCLSVVLSLSISPSGCSSNDQAESHHMKVADAAKTDGLSMAQDQLIFYIGKNPVGTFCGFEYPDAPGRVEYAPYRGEGHAQLAAALNKEGKVQCWFSQRGKRVSFEVQREEFVLDEPGSKSHWYLEIIHLDN